MPAAKKPKKPTPQTPAPKTPATEKPASQTLITEIAALRELLANAPQTFGKKFDALREACLAEGVPFKDALAQAGFAEREAYRLLVATALRAPSSGWVAKRRVRRRSSGPSRAIWTTRLCSSASSANSKRKRLL
jgi:hypothetical protein